MADTELFQPRTEADTIFSHYAKDPLTRTVFDDLTYINSTNIGTWATITLLVGGGSVLFLYLWRSLRSGRRSDPYTGGYQESGGYQDSGGYHDRYYTKRSALEGLDVISVIQWIAVIQEAYGQFELGDLECRQRLVCQVLREQETFGHLSSSLRAGLQVASLLEALNLPDDLRDALDEYLDASERAEEDIDCDEVFQCPYSLKDSVRRNLSVNSL